mmetsp:Transcript_59020/g.120921  ORF Transcript_59020/g.120921 Transcript_59020/m.120921 type:complete len:344 (+) Transcript_59020:52-1083(+)
MSSSEENILVEVTIPENSVAGDKITVECPDSKLVEFVTPDNAAPGDTVHVMVNNHTEEAVKADSKDSSDKKSGYGGVAAVTTGVLVGALVLGPIITSAVVVGVVVCAVQRKSTKSAEATTEEAAVGTDEEQPTGEAGEEAKGDEEEESREQKIANSFRKVSHDAFEQWSQVDDRFGISESTIQAIANVQEFDERNKISSSVVGTATAINEKYDITGNTARAITTGVDKVRELDASCHLTENATNAGTQMVSCVQDYDRTYSLTTRLTTAILFSMATLHSTLNTYVYPNTITDADAADGEESAAEGIEESKKDVVDAVEVVDTVVHDTINIPEENMAAPVAIAV